jgi:hypothetical protein
MRRGSSFHAGIGTVCMLCKGLHRPDHVQLYVYHAGYHFSNVWGFQAILKRTRCTSSTVKPLHGFTVWIHQMDHR